MAIQAVDLSYGELGDRDNYGVALIDTVSGFPLPISRGAFTDTDDAEDFVNWCRDVTGDPRGLDTDELARVVADWNDDDRRIYNERRDATGVE